MNPAWTSQDDNLQTDGMHVNPTPPIRLDEQALSPQHLRHRRHVGFGSQSPNPHARRGALRAREVSTIQVEGDVAKDVALS